MPSRASNHSCHGTPNSTHRAPRAAQHQSLLAEGTRLPKSSWEKSRRGWRSSSSHPWGLSGAATSSGDAELFHRRCRSTALLADVTRASPVKAVTSISLSATGAGQGTEGFYLLCVTHHAKLLETLDKQLGSIFRLESKTKINSFFLQSDF